MTSSRHTVVCDCGAQVQWNDDPPQPIARIECPQCGAEHLFSSFEKMDVALSEKCNYRCIMCRRQPDEEATLDRTVVFEVMEQARELGLKVISFCGGEPFVHPDFVEIAERAIDLGFKVQLTTNGSLVTAEALERLSGLDCLTVSIDALQTTHDRIRDVPGAFERAVQALQLAGQAGITCGTNTVIQHQNARELLPLFEHLVAATIGRGLKLDYVRHAPVEITPELEQLMVHDDEVELVQAQLRKIAELCDAQDVYFSHREQLLSHLPLFLDKWTRHRPLGGCRIPRKFIGYSHLGFYLCWHQGRSIRAPSLVEALASDVAQHVVTEAAEGCCVGCNALTYSWDEEWNSGILAGKLVHDGTLTDGETRICGEWSP